MMNALHLDLRHKLAASHLIGAESLIIQLLEETPSVVVSYPFYFLNFAGARSALRAQFSIILALVIDVLLFQSLFNCLLSSKPKSSSDQLPDSLVVENLHEDREAFHLKRSVRKDRSTLFLVFHKFNEVRLYPDSALSSHNKP